MVTFFAWEGAKYCPEFCGGVYVMPFVIIRDLSTDRENGSRGEKRGRLIRISVYLHVRM
jgi:hypothetical protein